MKILCPALDYKIPVGDCVGCEEPCNNKIELEAPDMIMELYSILYPNCCFIDIHQAYKMIKEKLAENFS